MKNAIKIAVFGLTIAAAVAPASAGPVTFNGMGLNRSIDYNFEGEARRNRAGQILITFEGKDHASYCVDLKHFVQNNWTATVAPVTFVNNGLAIAYLYDHFAHTVTTNLQAAGLQAAIWEVLTDYSILNFAAGDFRLKDEPSVASVAQGFLDALPADLSGYVAKSFIVKSGNHPRSQHLIIPEPATLGLLALGLPLILRRRSIRDESR